MFPGPPVIFDQDICREELNLRLPIGMQERDIICGAVYLNDRENIFIYPRVRG